MPEYGERHSCKYLEDHWTMITEKDGEATLWGNSTGNPQSDEIPELKALVAGIRFCPYCGERFGNADEATDEIEDELRSALMCVENVGYRNMSEVSVLRARDIYHALLNGDIQIVILNPALRERFTPLNS